MKILTISACATILFLGLTSCSTNENLDVDALVPESRLKSYKTQKDINGRYSIDYTVTSNTVTEVVKNIKTNVNEIHLYSGKVAVKENYNEALAIENNKLSISFLEHSKTKTSFIVEDDNIVLAKGQKNNNFLQKHSFLVEGNTVQLDFKVRAGINVSFVYNEADNIYEIHLKEGKSNNLSFSKVFVKNDGNPLKVDFVNHINNTASRGIQVGRRRYKRPRIVVS